MDTQDAIGTIISEDQRRDAIHIAVAPMIATENLKAGQHVGLAGDSEHAAATGTTIGIVDPFLTAPVKPGQRFFMFLYPNTIKSLRHQWTHPSFDGDSRSESEVYLRAFAERLFSYYGKYDGEGSKFDLLLSQAEHGGFGTDIEYGPNCQPTDEFWDHFERYTGKKVSHRHEHFRCAC